MALDSADRRSSALGHTLPRPDSTIGEGDRAHLLGLYAALSAAAPAVSWLSAAQLASMRAAMLSSFPALAGIRRRTVASDGQGGMAESWSLHQTVRCRLVHRTGTETLESGRVVALSQWEALLPYGTELLATDRLQIDGREYEVGSLSAPASEALCLAVLLRGVH